MPRDHLCQSGTIVSRLRAALNLGDASPTARREVPKYSVTSDLALTSMVMKAHASSGSPQGFLLSPALHPPHRNPVSAVRPLLTSTGQTSRCHCTLITTFSNQRPQQNPWKTRVTILLLRLQFSAVTCCLFYSILMKSATPGEIQLI